MCSLKALFSSSHTSAWMNAIAIEPAESHISVTVEDACDDREDEESKQAQVRVGGVESSWIRKLVVCMRGTLSGP